MSCAYNLPFCELRSQALSSTLEGVSVQQRANESEFNSSLHGHQLPLPFRIHHGPVDGRHESPLSAALASSPTTSTSSQNSDSDESVSTSSRQSIASSNSSVVADDEEQQPGEEDEPFAFTKPETQQGVIEQRWIQQQASAQSVAFRGEPASSGGSRAIPDRVRCNRRRRGPATGCRPEFKRDTDVTDDFVSLLILFATRLVTAIWPLSASPPKSTTCFNGAGVLPLKVFITETLRRSKTSYSTLQVALYYLILLKDTLPDCDFTREQPADNGCRALQCGRRMFLSALMLASKYVQDRNYSTRAWSKMSGLRNAEINENETKYLMQIDYRLHLPKESFDNWTRIVLALSKLAGKSPLTIPCGLLDSHQDGDAPASGSVSLSGSEICSDLWWRSLVKALKPAIIKDSSKTECFIRRMLPQDLFTTCMPQPGLCMQNLGPSEQLQSPDKFLDELSAMREKPEASFAADRVPIRERVPIRSGSVNVPFQPYLPNLPTPQSTPRASLAMTADSSDPRPTLRCAGSMSALSSLKKQCFLNANLDRCPPPQPQPHTLPPPEKSSFAWRGICAVATPLSSLASSPASTVSDVSCFTTRSRSSSISSTSSWSAVPLRKTRQQLWDVGPRSPLSRIYPQEPDTYDISSTVNLAEAVNSTSASPKAVAVEHASTRPMGKAHDNDKYLRLMLSRETGEESLEAEAAQALMSLHSSPLRQCTTSNGPSSSAKFNRRIVSLGPSRAHKRALSRTADTLQDRVSQLMSLSNVTDDTVLNPTSSTYHQNAEKQWQTPSKSWAAPKKPLPNAFNTKRMAVPCSFTGYESAAEIASQYLRDDVTVM